MKQAMLLALSGALFCSTPADSSFPGANGLIAFTRGSGDSDSVGLVSPDGSGIATIVEDAASPAWSADGRALVFQRAVSGDLELFTVGADGTGLRRITHRGRDDFLPAWSPDRRRIVFTSDRRGGDRITADAEIYVVNTDGSRLRRVTRNRVIDDSPAWSPDGKRIVFVRGGPKPGIYSLVLSGKRLFRLTRTRNDGAPAWSPDGHRIAFDRDRRGSSGQDLFVMNADGSNAHVVVASPTDDYMPAWAPDGTKLTFSRASENGDGDIYVADVDGEKITSLVADSDDTFGTDWQPVR